MVEKKSVSGIAFDVVNHLALGLLALLCAYPLWYVFIASLSNPNLRAIGLLLPTQFTLFNYASLFSMEGLSGAALVSILRTLVGVALSVLAVSFMAYLFTKRRMPCRQLIYRFFIVTMYVSGGLIPTFLTYKAYGLRNTFWVYVLPGMISAYNMILVKTYIENSIPASLEESAMLDGAGYFVAFVRIIFPLSLPIVATVAIFVAVGQWNSWFDNMIYTASRKELTTLQYMLYQKLNEASLQASMLNETNLTASAQARRGMTLTPNAVRMTMTMIVTLPVLLVYPFMQRFFMKGIMIGAVKG